MNTSLATPEGPGSVCGAPHLPAGFTGTFTSRYLRGSFGIYRAFPAIIAQNEQRKTRRLTLPVLAIGGEQSAGDRPGNTMKLVADDVQTMVLAGSGHWVAEQATQELLAALTAFLAPYKDAPAAARAASTRA